MTYFRLSKYAIPFKKNGINLVFVTKNCNFYEFDNHSFNFLLDLPNKKISNNSSEYPLIKPLIKKGIVCSAEEDQTFLNRLKLTYLTAAFNTKSLSLTLAPTISCNLRCPYCFENNKPIGIMDKNTADLLIEFINSHSQTEYLDLTWFGGEPMVGVDIINYLLHRISTSTHIKMKSHSMITNGTLLTPKNTEIFKSYPLDSIQITLDGKEATHNKKRFFADNTGSFNLIIDNIGYFISAFPETRVSIRINVDNHNSNEFTEVSSFVKSIFKNNKNIFTYPGILRANKGCESEAFFTTDDHLNFFKKLWNQGEIYYGYPTHCSKGCTATRLSSYVIGPKGEIYKCWEHVGNEQQIIGNIKSECIYNESLLNNYILNGHCFDDPHCIECPLIPICSGGCPQKRIENFLRKADHNLCSVYNGNNGEAIKDLLYYYYNHIQSK